MKLLLFANMKHLFYSLIIGLVLLQNATAAIQPITATEYARTNILLRSSYIDEGVNLNVRWFKATGDGSTDDTAAIRAAVAYWQLLPRGATLYFPAGTYKITDTIIIRTQNKDIRGEGFMTWLQCDFSGKPALMFEGKGASALDSCNNIAVKNLVVFGGYSGKAAIQIGGRTNLTYYASDGLDQPVTGVHLQDVWCYGAPLVMFRAYDCYVTQSTFEAQASYGIVILTSGRIRVSNSTAYSNGGLVYIGQSGSLGRSYGIIVQNNNISLSWVGLASLNDTYDSIIENNVGHVLGRHATLQPDQSGIYVGANCSGLLLKNNILRSGSDGQKLQYGIDIAYATTNLNATGNDLSDSTFAVGPLNITAGCTNLTLYGNVGVSNIIDRWDVGRGTGYNALIGLQSAHPFYIGNFNSPSRFSVFDGSAEWFNIASDGSATFVSTVQADGYKTTSGIGLSTTLDVLVSNGTTNRLVFSGGILISNITTFYP